MTQTMTDKANENQDEALPSYDEYQKKSSISYTHFENNGDGLVGIYLANDHDLPKPGEVILSTQNLNIPQPPQQTVTPLAQHQVYFSHLNNNLFLKKVIMYLSLIVIICTIVSLIIVMIVQYVRRY